MPATASFSANFGRIPVGMKSPMHFAGLADAALPEDENVLHGDDFAFHAGDFGDVDDFARAVAEAADLNDDVDGRGDLAANGAVRNVQAGHGDHGFQAAQGVARRVRVNRGERAVVAGVHGLQHVQRFFAADLTDDDAVGAHTQGVDEQFALLDGALAFDVGWARFQADDVILVELQFGRVFDGDDAFAIGDEGGQHVEQRGFTGAGAARDQNVEPRFHAAVQQLAASAG